MSLDFQPLALQTGSLARPVKQGGLSDRVCRGSSDMVRSGKVNGRGNQNS